MLVDGSKVQNPSGLLKEVQDRWGCIVGSKKQGLIDHCSRNNGEKVAPGLMIRRPSSKVVGETLTQQEQAYKASCAEAKSRVDYLAKSKTKGTVPHGVREYGASEVKGK